MSLGTLIAVLAWAASAVIFFLAAFGVSIDVRAIDAAYALVPTGLAAWALSGPVVFPSRGERRP